KGTLVSDIAENVRAGELTIGHPGGAMKLEVKVTADGDGWIVDSATIFRTSRTIMEGNVIIPASKLQTN
ncbi:MAG: PrpF domain-containing protein, partial [Anaerolineales bacterium]|nr:PrpF domain-containing protein [Anaerolineales bacterium]